MKRFIILQLIIIIMISCQEKKELSEDNIRELFKNINGVVVDKRIENIKLTNKEWPRYDKYTGDKRNNYYYNCIYDFDRDGINELALIGKYKYANEEALSKNTNIIYQYTSGRSDTLKIANNSKCFLAVVGFPNRNKPELEFLYLTENLEMVINHRPRSNILGIVIPGYEDGYSEIEANNGIYKFSSEYPDPDTSLKIYFKQTPDDEAVIVFIIKLPYGPIKWDGYNLHHRNPKVIGGNTFIFNSSCIEHNEIIVFLPSLVDEYTTWVEFVTEYPNTVIALLKYSQKIDSIIEAQTNCTTNINKSPEEVLLMNIDHSMILKYWVLSKDIVKKSKILAYP